METNVYNVIWADDEIDVYYINNEINKSRLRKENVNVIGYARTSNELREQLNEMEDMVDAVITDGNFDKKRLTDFKDSTSGLSEVLSFINEYNRKKFIPFFLYTGKGPFLKEKFSDGELEYFEKRGRLFEKGKFKELLKQIKKVVDDSNTPQFRIRNKYAAEFEAATLIDGAVENLIKGLLYIYDENSWKDVQDFFNPARKIFERIKNSCVEMNLLPPHISLNIASKLLSGLPSNYSLKTELMEKPLAESLHFFLTITQDGSHDDCDMRLGVDQYVRNTHNINLYRTVLYIAMDLLLWHKKMKQLYSENNERLWDSNFIYEGEVCQHPQFKFLYAGIYQIDGKETDLKVGDRVGILKSIANNHSTDDISEYVHNNNFVILEHGKQ